MLGANGLLGGPLSAEQVMELAVREEGHPDNLAAALRGGFTVTCWDAEARAALSLPVPPVLRFALLVPDQEASTAEARAALPGSYPRADAVFNVGRTALLLAAIIGERWDLLGAAMADRLHQPYRARALFPWLTTVFDAARAAGAYGVALSGAGPSVLAVAGVDAAPAAACAMLDALRREGLEGRALVLDADRRGAQVTAPTQEFSD
jgi:homoserine kinase